MGAYATSSLDCPAALASANEPISDVHATKLSSIDASDGILPDASGSCAAIEWKSKHAAGSAESIPGLRNKR